MPSSSSAPLDLGVPTELNIPDCVPNEMGSDGSASTGSSPRHSPPAHVTGTKRPIHDATPGTHPTRRTSARRSLESAAESAAMAVEDDRASCATSVAPSVLPSPAASLPSPSPNASSTATTPAEGSERKIWMRPCNDCGFELHVRRVRCTACGSVQVSKRALSAAHEERMKEEHAKLQAEAAARSAAAAKAQEEARQAKAAEEAKEAASQLALIAEIQKGRAEARSAAEREATPSGPASNSQSSVMDAVAQLTPEQLTKLRRMHKLRALLNKLPPGVKLPASSAAAPADKAPAEEANGSAVAAPATDAISMLASVACM